MSACDLIGKINFEKRKLEKVKKRALMFKQEKLQYVLERIQEYDKYHRIKTLYLEYCFSENDNGKYH